MGNVSYLVPSIHPMLRVAPPGVAIHTADFTRHAADHGGDDAVIHGAMAMAATVIDLWADDALRATAHDSLVAATSGGHPAVM